jgi:hypothetical protein
LVLFSINVENVIGMELDFLTEVHAVGERVVVQNAHIVSGSNIFDDDPHAFVGPVIREMEPKFDMIAGTQTLTRRLGRYLKGTWSDAMALNAAHQNVCWVKS